MPSQSLEGKKKWGSIAIPAIEDMLRLVACDAASEQPERDHVLERILVKRRSSQNTDVMLRRCWGLGVLLLPSPTTPVAAAV